MFNTTKIEKLTKEIEVLKELLAKEKDINKSIEQKHRDDTERQNNKHKDELDRLKANIDVEITKKTSSLSKELSESNVKVKILEREVEMYTKAFENLGFDVKDMKDILNKLVDGIVSKNQIQLVK